ncbi:MAG: primosomal protein N' [Phycisphaerales bacterium]|nr:primosomal protein N' [Phycisphaerales bacterium]
MLPFQPDTNLDESEKLKPGESLIRVAVERGLDLEDGLTYRTQDPVEEGQRVTVPIGRGNSMTDGYVLKVGGLELSGGLELLKIKYIHSTSPVIVGSVQLRLCKWIAKYYACPIGMVLSASVPKAVKSQIGRRSVQMIRRVEPLPDPLPKLPPTAQDALERLNRLESSRFPIEKPALKDALHLKSIAPIHKLRDAGILSEYTQEIIRTPSVFQLLENPKDLTPPPLNPEQQEVVEGITAKIDQPGTHLIHGITGSGKTEVYMRLIEQVLKSGKTTLVLVPEIALTPQTAGRFVTRFQDAGVALLHSGLSAGARNAQWSLVESGEAKVVIGPRSAIFAPIKDLGLVIVDEEHDSSYKQDRAPRYHARDCAVVLGALAKCPVVLGSATPSLESWSNARSGRYSHWSMLKRAGLGSLPKVEIVDLTKDQSNLLRSEAGKPIAFQTIGATLENAINETLDRGEQVILLLNRRGYASLVGSADPSCDWKLECEQCDSTMVVHKSRVRSSGGRRFVRCHHCLSEQIIPTVCPMTGKGVVQIGVGTQRAEDEVMMRLGERQSLTLGENFVRVDSDTMSRPSDYFDILDRYSKGDIKLILGTQMIAKGLDFPNVTLVGILNADTSLSIPDFRAEERTFQLVAQVAGRAGRSSVPGRVIVQTMNPRNASIVLASQHDFAKFADQELRTRNDCGLPPSTRMARIICRDSDYTKAKSRAEQLADAIVSIADPSVTIEGPMECTIARISNQARWGIELIAPGSALIQQPINTLRKQGFLTSDASTIIDMDPIWLM